LSSNYNTMTHASLFSGIGGFDLAAQWMGWDNLFHCEWNPFCQTVLKYHWPNATTYTDITTTDFTLWNGRVDVLTGGFPCQPFSSAGQRKGTSDDRYLWPQMLRAIREIAPRYVVGENVDGIFTWNDGLVFETVCADLENEGYEVQSYRIAACATGAPHRRDRWWFVGHAKHHGRTATKNTQSGGTGGDGHTARPHQFQQPTGPALSWENATNPTEPGLSQPRQTGERELPAESEGRLHHRPEFDACHATHTDHTGLQGRKKTRNIGGSRKEHYQLAGGYDSWSEHWLEAATRLCILDDGLPGRLDTEALSFGKPMRRPYHAFGKWRKESLKAAGNAIVPQVAYEIFKAIQHTENLTP